MTVRSHVPPETLRLIFENLDENLPALNNLSLTSRLFNLEATRLLYKKIVVDDGTRNYKVLATIKRKPHLAALIHTYHTPITVHSQKRPFWTLLTQCLLLMTGLKELAYRAIWVKPESVFPAVRKGQPFPFQLERLIWTVGQNIDRFTHVYQIKVIDFFGTQHELRSLTWVNTTLSRTIPTSHFANLKIVEADIHIIRMLVPSRPTITEVYWRDCCRNDLEVFIREESSLHQDGVFAHLRGLSVLVDASQRFLHHICLPDSFGPISNTLKVLELALQSFEGQSQFLRRIPVKFPQLKRFCIIDNRLSVTANEWKTLHHHLSWELLEVMNGLACIDIRSVKGEDLYKRWVSRSAPPEAVIIPDNLRLRSPGLE